MNEIIVGVSRDRGWPVFRLKEMNDPGDLAEVERYRLLFESAPAMYEALKMLTCNGINVTDRGKIGGQNYDIPTLKRSWDMANKALSLVDDQKLEEITGGEE